jgi:hypothetical protein
VDNRAATLLRYRFDDLRQLQRHLHVADTRTLLFYRDPRLALAGGARVLVEVAFSRTEQVSTLRGAVLGRVEGTMSGLWLEFADSRFVKKADQGMEAMAQRKRKRLGCDLMVELRQDQGTTMGRLIDVSMTGGRVAGVNGLRPGVQLEVRLMMPAPGLSAALGKAEVVRAEAGDAGLNFLRRDPASRVAASKLFQYVQDSWSRAIEVTHPTICCQGGLVLEPPLPHMKGRS